MEALHFCRDGILRRSFGLYNSRTQTHTTHLTPLRAYEAAVDPHVFLKSLHNDIHLEAGLTVEEFMENLAPWAETMIGVGVLDFPAFLEEMRRDPVAPDTEVEKISLVYQVSLSAVPDFHKPSSGEIIGKSKITGKLQIEEGWSMEARLTPAGREAYDGAESVAIDYTPMSEWKHLPIEIVAQVHFTTRPQGGLNRGISASSSRPPTQAIHLSRSDAAATIQSCTTIFQSKRPVRPSLTA